ncbi:MAG TPA: YigZ family protein [Prolixibacteraceae bacterium]|nr:YigZ family protein [Prolixibacteraceae bacterium]
MDIKDTYLTIDLPSEGIFKDKGSKFLAFAYPLTDESKVKNIVQNLKKEHHSARHHCFAFKIGNQGEQYRANDDGEPSGTAGRPILGQLNSYNLTNILVVVVRYFGGTLLGVGGLINAYKNATIEALENASIVEKIIETHYQLRFDYPLQNTVMKVLKDFNTDITNSQFEMDCRLSIAVRLSNEEAVINILNKIDGLSLSKIEKH